MYKVVFDFYKDFLYIYKVKWLYFLLNIFIFFCDGLMSKIICFLFVGSCIFFSIVFCFLYRNFYRVVYKILRLYIKRIK